MPTLPVLPILCTYSSICKSWADANRAWHTVSFDYPIRGHVVVDDVLDALDVETPRGDCSGDEDGHLAELEVCQSSLTLPLEPVAVDGGSWEALYIQDIFREMGIMTRSMSLI